MIGTASTEFAGRFFRIGLAPFALELRQTRKPFYRRLIV